MATHRTHTKLSLESEDSWQPFASLQRHFGSKDIAQSATGGDPSRLEKAGRSRICLSVDGKQLKVDCGFGLDDSKSSDALLLRCSYAEVGQDRASGVD